MVYLKSVVLYQFVSEGGSYLVIGFANVRLGETPFNDQLLHNEFIMSQHVEHERSYNSVPPMGSFDLNLLVPKGLDSQI
ncbi:hypothetical protein AALP_AA5G167400 [Arabis alpina]|uniref:Uncharacterized protein n=1 Tax=Arabis alpina TaxID=50452 RepID=A0A087GXK4_ARAAL|nr:hypothetical protein AALP_AA5G167400 [Arabis alpina]